MMNVHTLVLQQPVIDHYKRSLIEPLSILITLATFLFYSPITSHAQSNQVADADEFSALKAIWENTGGPTWTNKTNWPTTGNWPTSATAVQMSTWYGVTITNGDVNVINLSNNNLNGTLPDEINKLKKLRILEVSTNKLRSSPRDLTNLVALENFSANNNLIEGALPVFKTNLLCLGQISLQFNRFSGAIPPSYGSHSRMMRVFLNDNNLTGNIPPELGSLSALTHLMIHNNRLTGPIPVELGKLSSLQTLYLYNNKLTGSLPSSLENLTRLVWLYAHSNNLSGTIPPIFSSMSELRGLQLQNNKLSGTLPPVSGSAIDVSNNMFTGEVPALATTVQTFNGSNNGFTGVASTISSCTILTTLNLQNNELTSLPSSLSTHPNRANLQILLQNNRLDYGILEPLVNGLKPSSVLMPQKNIKDQSSQPITIGSELNFNARPSGLFTTVTWEKQTANGSWSVVSNNSKFTRSPVSKSDEGIYRWRSVSTKFNGTSIQSDPIQAKTTTHFANDNWSFQYKYDARKRMTHKKIPGAGWIYMVYDDRDRLVMTQDGEQRKSNRWTITRFDSQNRPVITALYTHGRYLSQAGMDSLVSKSVFAESFTSSGPLWGYTNSVFPTTDLEILTVTYYDNYNFLKGTSDFAYKDNQLQDQYRYNNTTGTSFPRTTGLVTGRRTKTLSAHPYWMLSVNYYDDNSRVVQTVSETYKAGIDRITRKYDFSGKVIGQRLVHTANNVKWQNMTYTQIAGNKMLRLPGGTTWGASGASSVQYIPASKEGWAEATVTETTTWRYWGLSDDDTDKQPGSIDYAFYLFGSSLHVYESGVFRYAVPGGELTGDRLRIARVGSTVRFYKNNALVYTSNTPSTKVLRLDIAGGSNYATILNLNLSHAKSVDTVTRWFNYDHAGRLVRTWYQLNDDDKVLVAENKYNEIGQLIDKKLHSADSVHFKQSIDYRYNIRGWMTSMNRREAAEDNDAPTDLFAMDLYYDRSAAGLSNASMSNGNISAMQWKSVSTDMNDKAYLYAYDPMGRLASARYVTGKENHWNHGNLFSESKFKYDLNGNIARLNRTGDKGILVDDLVYNYGSGVDASNRLIKVNDAADVTTGFIDDKRSSEEYSYDLNGNLVADNNKGISIEYNHLNLPSRVAKARGESIHYFYDSDGKKVNQIVFNSASVPVKVTDYEGDFVYENDTLQFIHHEDGRVVMTGPQPEYQYHLKDHLGNIRITFTTNREIDRSVADFETETMDFQSYSGIVKINSEVFDHTAEGPTYYSERLNGTPKERFGLAKSLRVNPGDTINAKVFAKYLDPDTTWTSGMQTFINSILTGTAPVGTRIDGFLIGKPSDITNLPEFLPSSAYPPRASDPSAPRAYLNWLIFDNDYNMVRAGYEQISNSGREYGQNGLHDTVKTRLTFDMSGYVYLYLSNDNYAMTGKVVDVFFDDFTVEHIKSPVIQADDYYPFGLTFNSYQRESSSNNRWKFQGQEHQDDLGLNWDSFRWRNHQPDLGRFFNVDPLSEKYYHNSPYAFSENKVVVHVELEGLESVYVFDKPTRPNDNGVAGTGYPGTVYVVHDNGTVNGPYSGSSYPNSKSNTDNNTSHRTIDEGTHLYNNESGHKSGSKQGLNIVDENGNRVAPGKEPDGSSATMTVVNVHEGFSDADNYSSRGSKGCITIRPIDAAGFFSNFDWSGSNGKTGTSAGTVTIHRSESEQKTLDEIKIKILKIISELQREKAEH